jgi:hydroxymethylglutaryl-CoA lyase
MSNLPSSVRIMEVGPRDGLQIERTVFSTERKVDLVNRLVGAGLRQIEVGSFVNPKGVPQMADSGEVFVRLPKQEGVEYHGLWLNAKGLDRAVENGHVKFTGKLMLTATDTFSKRNTNKTIDETLQDFPNWIARYRKVGIEVDDVQIPAAFGCNFEGPVPVEKVVPEQTRRLIGAIRDRWPDLQIRLHLHDTRGTAIANASAGLDLGVCDFDSSIGGLGGCPFAGNKGAAGNACTEDLVFLCEEMGVKTGVDLDALIEVSRFAEEMVGHELPGKLMKSRSLARYRRLADGSRSARA